MAMGMATIPALAGSGFHISGTQLLDGNGKTFMLRGINHPHCWYTSTTQKAIQDMAAKKANTVRIVMSTGDQWTKTTADDVAQIIQWCKDNKVIAVLEVHDCTGYGDTSYSPNAVAMSKAVDYWISIANKLIGQEDYVILNIANEPLGNNLTSSKWVSDNKDAVTRLRAAGLKHTLMIDCGNWGQDWEQVSLNNASQVWSADSQQNLLFSVHMYQVYQSYSTVDTYLKGFLAKGMPLVVGEFGSTNGTGVTVDATDILERCNSYQVGYMGWSWSGNGSYYADLDVVTNFDATKVTTWGNQLLNSTYGIAATAKTCSIYETQSSLSVNPTSVSLAATAGSSSVAVMASSSWTASSSQTWLTLSAVSGSGSGTLTLTAQANVGSTARTATVTLVSGSTTSTVTVTQAAQSSGDTNVALGKTVTASSVEGTSTAAAYAVDGSASTRWSSAYSDPQWIMVDLGATYQINKVVLAWEAAYGKAYQIQVSSDATNWTSVYSTSSGAGGTENLSVSGTGRYVRMYGTARGTQWGYSLWEFQVMGTPSQNTLSVTPTTATLTSGSTSSAVSLTATGAWTASSNQSWLTLSPASGTGNATVNLAASANTGTTSRSASVTFTSGSQTQVVTVSQDVPSSTFSVTPSTASVVAEGGNTAVSVTSSSSWTASSDQSWLSLSSTSGSGNGSLSLTAAANTSASARTATVTFTSGGKTQTVVITQPGQSSGGPATVTTSVTGASSQWFMEEDVKVVTSAPITAMTVTVTIAKTTGAKYSGMYDNMGRFARTYVDNGSSIVYTFVLNAGNTLDATSLLFANQLSLSGTVHPTTGDSWTLSYTSAGKAYSASGKF